MTDKELIRQEIERRYNCEKCYPLDREANVAAAVLQELLLFIDSLPEEHNEDLEEASEEYAFTNWESDDYHEGAEEDIPFDPIGHTKKCFIAGAEWQKQKAMQDFLEKAERFIEDTQIENFICRDDGIYFDNERFIEQFKNYMKNEM